jgi:hypothetical protein
MKISYPVAIALWIIKLAIPDGLSNGRLSWPRLATLAGIAVFLNDDPRSKGREPIEGSRTSPPCSLNERRLRSRYSPPAPGRSWP